MKSNYVVILKDGAKHFEKVKVLSKNKPFTEYSDKGWFCVIGNFKKEDIKEYEYYSIKKDWQTESGFMDRGL